MYTEENEFNYNDYIDDDDYKSQKNKRFIFRLIIIILLILLIIFLIVKIANRNSSNKKNNKNNPDSGLVYTDNMGLLRDASYKYFFYKNNLPSEVGDRNYVTVKTLKEQGLIDDLKDKTGYCRNETSSAAITKNENDYKMELTLNCSIYTSRDEYYYDLEGNCLTCNGEVYISSKEETKTTDEPVEVVEPTQTEPVVTPVKACSDFTAWTTTNKFDSNLEKETRTLVKAYIDEVTYGNWSDPTETKIVGNDNLQVEVYTDTKKETSKKCSDESTTKPASKEGREITSRKVAKTKTSTVCVGGGKETRTLTKWDNNADSCVSQGIGKVVCTYTTPCTKKTVKDTYYVTYYSYCDTVSKDVTKTMYKARVVNHNLKYTDYILESEIPAGYTKVNGSELTQYRYREKCGK